MLITCPQCGTEYNVPDSLKETGLPVRCARCGNVWETGTAEPEPLPESAPQPEPDPSPDFETDAAGACDFFLQPPAPAPVIDESDIPLTAFQDFLKQPEKKKTSVAVWIRPLYFATLFFIAAAVYLFFFHAAARAPVTLQTLTHETAREDYKTFLILKTAAFNNTDRDIAPETFSVRFSDDDGRTLTTVAVASPVAVLKARGTERVDLKIERPPAKTAKATVTLTKYKMN